MESLIKTNKLSSGNKHALQFVTFSRKTKSMNTYMLMPHYLMLTKLLLNFLSMVCHKLEKRAIEILPKELNK